MVAGFVEDGSCDGPGEHGGAIKAVGKCGLTDVGEVGISGNLFEEEALGWVSTSTGVMRIGCD